MALLDQFRNMFGSRTIEVNNNPDGPSVTTQSGTAPFSGMAESFKNLFNDPGIILGERQGAETLLTPNARQGALDAGLSITPGQGATRPAQPGDVLGFTLTGRTASTPPAPESTTVGAGDLATGEATQDAIARKSAEVDLSQADIFKLAAAAGVSPTEILPFLTTQYRGSEAFNRISQQLGLDAAKAQVGSTRDDLRGALLGNVGVGGRAFREQLEALGVPALENQLSGIDQQIAQANSAFQGVLGQIANNPSLSTAQILRQQDLVAKQAQDTLGQLTGFRDSIQNTLDRKEGRATTFAGFEADEARDLVNAYSEILGLDQDEIAELEAELERELGFDRERFDEENRMGQVDLLANLFRPMAEERLADRDLERRAQELDLQLTQAQISKVRSDAARAAEAAAAGGLGVGANFFTNHALAISRVQTMSDDELRATLGVSPDSLVTRQELVTAAITQLTGEAADDLVAAGATDSDARGLLNMSTSDAPSGSGLLF